MSVEFCVFMILHKSVGIIPTKYIFSQWGGAQGLSKTVSIIFIRLFWTILQAPNCDALFSGIEYNCTILVQKCHFPTVFVHFLFRIQIFCFELSGIVKKKQKKNRLIRFYNWEILRENVL